jgi:hypothetical protein
MDDPRAIDARHPSTPDCDLSIRLCAPCAPEASGFREDHQRLELVSAGFAFPQVPHAPWAQIFRPFRHKDRLAALSARIAKPRLDGFSGAGSEFHAVFLRRGIPSPTEAAYWEFADIKAVPLT